MPNGMTKKLLKIKPRAETRIAPISLTRWHSGVILKNYGRRTLVARRPDSENPHQSGSELGGQIAVDLKADTDFDECRCGPGHNLLHLVRSGSDPPAQLSISTYRRCVSCATARGMA
jgi:hypothetical protein